MNVCVEVSAFPSTLYDNAALTNDTPMIAVARTQLDLAMTASFTCNSFVQFNGDRWYRIEGTTFTAITEIPDAFDVFISQQESVTCPVRFTKRYARFPAPGIDRIISWQRWYLSEAKRFGIPATYIAPILPKAVDCAKDQSICIISWEANAYAKMMATRWASTFTIDKWICGNLGEYPTRSAYLGELARYRYTLSPRETLFALGPLEAMLNGVIVFGTPLDSDVNLGCFGRKDADMDDWWQIYQRFEKDAPFRESYVQTLKLSLAPLTQVDYHADRFAEVLAGLK